jgi:putative transposase
MQNELIAVGEVYHIYNRGVTRKRIFNCARDYRRFEEKMVMFQRLYGVIIYAYCLMPNHFHLVMGVAKEAFAMGKFMFSLQSSHAQFFNKKYSGSGHVLQSRYKGKWVNSDTQLQTLISYVLNNPVRKGLVKAARDWPYSAICEPELLRNLGVYIKKEDL